MSLQNLQIILQWRSLPSLLHSVTSLLCKQLPLPTSTKPFTLAYCWEGRLLVGNIQNVLSDIKSFVEKFSVAKIMSSSLRKN